MNITKVIDFLKSLVDIVSFIKEIKGGEKVSFLQILSFVLTVLELILKLSKWSGL